MRFALVISCVTLLCPVTSVWWWGAGRALVVVTATGEGTVQVWSTGAVREGGPEEVIDRTGG